MSRARGQPRPALKRASSVLGRVSVAAGPATARGDGGRHPLYHSNGNPNIWTTTDFWLYNPGTATLQLPNGLVEGRRTQLKLAMDHDLHQASQPRGE